MKARQRVLDPRDSTPTIRTNLPWGAPCRLRGSAEVRPAVSEKRLSLTPNGNVRYPLKTP